MSCQPSVAKAHGLYLRFDDLGAGVEKGKHRLSPFDAEPGNGGDGLLDAAAVSAREAVRVVDNHASETGQPIFGVAGFQTVTGLVAITINLIECPTASRQLDMP